jgi:hypothetical protein
MTKTGAKAYSTIHRFFVGTGPCYLRSFIWLSITVAIASSVAFVALLFFTDFIHGNQLRPRSDVRMMTLSAPLSVFFAFAGTLLVFGPAQIFQAILLDILRLFNKRANAIILAALPLAAIITWYSFDYLVPHVEPMEIPDEWEEYRHGITASRYLLALGAQLPVTLFNVAYLGAASKHGRRARLIIFALAAAVVGGVVLGYIMAVG